MFSAWHSTSVLQRLQKDDQFSAAATLAHQSSTHQQRESVRECRMNSNDSSITFLSMFKAAAINLTVWIEKKNRDSLWVKKRRKMVAEEESSKYTQQKRKKARGRQRCRGRGALKNSNYPGMAICPDIFQCSPQTICLKIPNVVVEQHSADGETRARPS